VSGRDARQRIIPQAKLPEVFEDGRPLSDSPGIASAIQEQDGVVLEIGSGKYEFKYPK